MPKEIKTIFVGTPDFALPSLRALARDTDFNIKAVITQPDRPRGRSQELAEPPVKQLALEYGYEEVWQPQKITQVLDNLRKLQPDVIVVCAYAQIIPKEILDLPKHGCINVHGSLLPKYRGAAVVQAPILNNDKETGVTIMLMDEQLDTGPILHKEPIAIADNETAGVLSERLAETGGKILPKTIKAYLKGKIEPQEQNDDEATYCPRLTKEDGLLDFSQQARKIERQVRAMTPWPGTWTWLKGKKLKIIKVSHEPIDINSYKPGKLFSMNNNLMVQCGHNALIIEELQLEGKQPITGPEFMRGYNDYMGAVLG